MARLNLLPWREAERERQKRLFTLWGVTGAVLTLLLALGSYFFIDALVLGQDARNAFLRAEIATLDRQIHEIKEIEMKKADLLARMEVIQALQQSRPGVVHLFDEIVTAIPDGVILTGLKQTEGGVVLEGRAQSYGRISAFMDNIKASAWINNPSLKLIEHKEKARTGLSHFELHFKQQSPAKPGEKETAT